MMLHPNPKKLRLITRPPVSKEEGKFRALVNRLTNWQRHQWRKAKYPGLHLWKEGPVRQFLKHKRPERIGHEQRRERDDIDATQNGHL